VTIAVDDARALVRDAAAALGVRRVEEVPVDAALGRVLAEGLRAGGDVPPFPNSAMDGYAVRAGAAGRVLRVAGEARAGHPASVRVEEGVAVRVSTGAALPAGADAVVRQEDADRAGEHVTLRVEAAPGANVRAAGEDMAAGAEVLAAGTPLGPAELAVAVAAGAGAVRVAARPPVAMLGTGDELRPPGAPLRPGEIHNSNAVSLAAQARRAGAEVVAGDAIPDDRRATARALARALERVDVVVVSGGVSVGPHDHVKPALAELGVEERFWRVALQPGKPTWFGARGDRLVFALPGNPVSAMVTFALFVAPALRRLQGAPEPPERWARLAEAVRRNPDREQAVRVTVRADDDGVLWAQTTGPQHSHRTRSMLGADALARVAAGEGELARGSVVSLLPL